MVNPHGGKLVDRVLSSYQREDLKKEAKNSKKFTLNYRQISDLYMISIGCFSPLEGFMVKEDYESVLEKMRLKDGTVWPIPITLPIGDEERRFLKEKERVSLIDNKGNILGVLEVEEIYPYDKKKEAELVYKTTDLKHPGVAYLFSQADYLVGGEVIMLEEPIHEEFKDYWYTPQQTRKIFEERGWRTVVGFQTRNPIHRAHEYIIKTALEIVDGLFLNPLVGETKKDDVPAQVRMKCYEVLLEKYFPHQRVLMGVYGAAMRYAGPREAILHAIVRKNFGCTHFIVGRDHAGVGNYYGPFEAQEIFDNFTPEEIGIIPLFFDNAFWCRHCKSMATLKTCPHGDEERIYLSGTRMRELLSKGEIPPPEIARPEVVNVLIEWYRYTLEKDKSG